MFLLITHYLPPHLRSGEVKRKRIDARSCTLQSPIEKRVQVKSISGGHIIHHHSYNRSRSPTLRESPKPQLYFGTIPLNHLSYHTTIPFSQIVPPIPKTRHVGSISCSPKSLTNSTLQHAGYAVGGMEKLHISRASFTSHVW